MKQRSIPLSCLQPLTAAICTWNEVPPGTKPSDFRGSLIITAPQAIRPRPQACFLPLECASFIATTGPLLFSPGMHAHHGPISLYSCSNSLSPRSQCHLPLPCAALPDWAVYTDPPLLSPVPSPDCPEFCCCCCFACWSVFLDSVHLWNPFFLYLIVPCLCLNKSALWKASSWRTWKSCLLV